MSTVTRRGFLARSAAAGGVAGLSGFGDYHVNAAAQENSKAVPSCQPIVLHDDGRFEYGQLLAGKISGGKLRGIGAEKGGRKGDILLFQQKVECPLVCSFF